MTLKTTDYKVGTIVGSRSQDPYINVTFMVLKPFGLRCLALIIKSSEDFPTGIITNTGSNKDDYIIV